MTNSLKPRYPCLLESAIAHTFKESTNTKETNEENTYRKTEVSIKIKKNQ